MMKFIAALLAFSVCRPVGILTFRFLVAGPSSKPTKKWCFKCPNGKSFSNHCSAAENLQAKGLISSAFRNLRLLAKLTRQGGKVKMGEYAFESLNEPPGQILSVLTSGKSILNTQSRFPEGSNIFEMAQAVEASAYLQSGDDFLTLVRDKTVVQ